MTVASKSKTKQVQAHLNASRTQPLCEHVRDTLNAYFDRLNGHDASALYELVLTEVEQPLLQVVLKQTGGNITKAAQVLGLNRGTLRKKLKKYGLS